MKESKLHKRKNFISLNFCAFFLSIKCSLTSNLSIFLFSFSEDTSAIWEPMRRNDACEQRADIRQSCIREQRTRASLASRFIVAWSSYCFFHISADRSCLVLLTLIWHVSMSTGFAPLKRTKCRWYRMHAIRERLRFKNFRQSFSVSLISYNQS